MLHPTHQLWEGITEETGDAQHHINPRTTKQGQWDHLQIRQAARWSIPDRPDTDQCQQLSDVLSAVAHRRCSPDREREVFQRLSVIEEVQIEQLFCGSSSKVPGGFRWQPSEIDGVEVASCRQHIRAPTARCSGRSCSQASSLCDSEEPTSFRPCAGLQCRPERLLDEGPLLRSR